MKALDILGRGRRAVDIVLHDLLFDLLGSSFLDVLEWSEVGLLGRSLLLGDATGLDAYESAMSA